MADTSLDIQALLERYCRNGKIAGGIGAVISKEGFQSLCVTGYRDREAGDLLHEDAVFRIYSMTKPITSLAAMMLWEEGCFDLDDPVVEYLPAFSETRIFQEGGANFSSPTQMTIRHVFCHTAGITLPAFSEDPLCDVYRAEGLDGMRSQGTLASVVDRLGRLPVLFEPGRRWKYSMATDILGRLIEVWSGQSFEDFLQKRIFDPLGMKETGFKVPEASRDRMTVNYAVTAEGINGVIDPAMDSQFFKDPEFCSGSGGLVSTLADFSAFMRMLIGRGEYQGQRLIKPDTLALMHDNHIGDDMAELGAGDFNNMRWDGIGFGLGFYTVMKPGKANYPGPAGEYGWTGAAGTMFFVNPQLEMGGLLLVQHMPGNIYTLRPDFRKAVYATL